MSVSIIGNGILKVRVGNYFIPFNYPSDLPLISGGSEYTKVLSDGKYKIHVFSVTGDNTIDVKKGGKVDVLVVAGGGAGGGTDDNYGGGGGAGGLIYAQDVLINPGSLSITVGGGGLQPNANHRRGYSGENSEALGLIALGGGGGGSQDGIIDAFDGGSGGGASYAGNAGNALQPGSVDGGFGYAGNTGGRSPNAGGGGGGAGSVGRRESADIPIGGDGRNYSEQFSDAFGDGGWFASGGGAPTQRGSGKTWPSPPGGGGPAQGYSSSIDGGEAGLPNTGGGGTGGTEAGIGSAGGSGIIIVRYLIQ